MMTALYATMVKGRMIWLGGLLQSEVVTMPLTELVANSEPLDLRLTALT